MDFDNAIEFENRFFLTAPVNRISKFVTRLDLFRKVGGLRGEIVECGVFKGVSLAQWIKLRNLLENPFSRRVIGFDTFGTFPEATRPDDDLIRSRFVEEAGDQSITAEEFMDGLKTLNLDQNVELVKGDVLETIPAYLEKNPHLRISLLHIDVDLYEPTRQCLKSLFPHVVRGGVVVLDDYGAFPGANEAVETYFSGTGYRIQKLPYSNAIAFVEKE